MSSSSDVGNVLGFLIPFIAIFVLLHSREGKNVFVDHRKVSSQLSVKCRLLLNFGKSDDTDTMSPAL